MCVRGNTTGLRLFMTRVQYLSICFSFLVGRWRCEPSFRKQLGSWIPEIDLGMTMNDQRIRGRGLFEACVSHRDR